MRVHSDVTNDQRIVDPIEVFGFAGTHR
jgi:hypothetical protein